jgi:ribosome biogenesis protein BMS1
MHSFEDITDPSLIDEHPKCSRTITVYGYLRGTRLKPGQSVHMLGVGDFAMKRITAMPDPCPLPSRELKRTLKYIFILFA